ncbi:repressor [Aeromonas veronii]|uniref:LexA family protein n=1 Tax=Aeromonas veronii TaxID=654 RepID=UPI00078C9077|nr:S24 family peptidase [Aeromonas veronii]AMQ45137.1 repressor [Aeromonas veronii]MCX0428009.1 helix-turn-helix domain-containing protein [Aeromonas veronii]MCX0447298.1 helix-turn-helix domain-containing protein [Aeromonas veronii]POG17340.1 phage repressor protein [Aeromonas veronii]
MKVSDRIKSARKKTGLSQDELSVFVGVSRAAISQWERGETTPRGKYLGDLATALGVTVEWLLTGSPSQPVEVGSKTAFSNTEPAVIPSGRRIPILSYVQAGHWRDMCDQAFGVDGNTEFVLAGIDVGEHAFGLWLRGNSMAPIFNEGDLVIIDPDESPRPGDYVIAKNGSEEATFKKYRPRGIGLDGKEVFELVPLNEDYPTLYSDRQHIEIIGVAIEHRRFTLRQR